MKKPLSVLAMGLICCIALVGCANKEKQLEGKWHATDVVMPPGGDPRGAAKVKSMMSSITLEFTPDKKFTIMALVPMNGDWTLKGQAVAMSMKTIAGMTMDQVKTLAKAQPGGSMTSQQENFDKPIDATISDDGKTLIVSGVAGQRGSITFEKNPS